MPEPLGYVDNSNILLHLKEQLGLVREQLSLAILAD